MIFISVISFILCFLFIANEPAVCMQLQFVLSHDTNKPIRRELGESDQSQRSRLFNPEKSVHENSRIYTRQASILKPAAFKSGGSG